MFNQGMFAGFIDTGSGRYILYCTGCEIKEYFTRREYNDLPNKHTSLCDGCIDKMDLAEKVATHIWKDVIAENKRLPSGIRLQKNGVYGLRKRIFKYLLGEQVFRKDELSIVSEYLKDCNIKGEDNV
jgi:hypothetical protein